MTEEQSLPQPHARQFLSAMWHGLGGTLDVIDSVQFDGHGSLPSVFAVSDFAASAIGAAGAALSELIGAADDRRLVQVDRRLASLWFGWSIQPIGWVLPAPWDAIAGDYAAADGWIRLHTNAPPHRDAALAVLGVPAVRDRVERAVAAWKTDELEDAVVARGGCAATMRSIEDWRAHPQGQAVNAAPLIDIRTTADAGTAWGGSTDRTRPLRGLRVLDLTRVLAGPIATRFLAGFGAEVLRVDPLSWDEPAVAPEVTLGKQCARLDLKSDSGRAQFLHLVRDAHVLVHGYRADAMDHLGLGSDVRRKICPGLVDVSLDAYGWSGPWRNRRGFDSLVQMSCGIADAGMRLLGKSHPTPLPVQALDHATGYLLAAAVIRGLVQRRADSRGFEARTSLARIAGLLIDGPLRTAGGSDASELKAAFVPAQMDDWSAEVERTVWGDARRLRPPVLVDEALMRWDRPAGPLGSRAAQWQTRKIDVVDAEALQDPAA